MENRKLKIGARGSQLSLWQAEFVKRRLLEKSRHLKIHIVPIRTQGDAETGPGTIREALPGTFTRRIENALLDGKIDIAVHSLKDLPVINPEGLCLAAVPEREYPADVLVSAAGLTLDLLPGEATVLTGSPRRRALLFEQRPDLRVKGIRGNVPTRIEKMRRCGADALVLAYAGLKRLGLQDHISETFDPCYFIPSPGQGALGIQTRADNHLAVDICAKIDHPASHLCVTAERSFFHAIGAGCHAAAGAIATTDKAALSLTGMILQSGEKTIIRKTIETEVKNEDAAVQAGRLLAKKIQEK